MPRVDPRKALLARVFQASGLNHLLSFARRGLGGAHARAVNYHDIGPDMVDGFEEQLRFYREHFVDVGRVELESLLRGEWRGARPGLLVTFDDGLRSHAEHAAPLLERYGFTGWFFVPTEFVDAPVAEQRAFAEAHQIVAYPGSGAGGRVAMSWEEIRDLADRGHVIGCHTRHHVRLGAELGASVLDDEVFVSKARLEEKLGRPVDVFCWVGGEEWSYSREAAEAIRRAGFRVSFMTNNAPIRPGTDPLQIQRTNIEAWFPLDVVRFQMNGVLDWLYMPKRRRVNALTATSPDAVAQGL